MTGTLILLRHGESTWNAQNLFTGTRDPELTDRGIEEARLAGRMLLGRGVVPDAWFTSALQRAYHTLDQLLLEMGISDLPITRNAHLYERDYGELSVLTRRR